MAERSVPGDGEDKEAHWASSAGHCAFTSAPATALSAPKQLGEGPGEWQSVSPPDLDPIEFSDKEELSSTLGNSVSTNCSAQGLPTPALRWTKVRRKGVPGPPPPLIPPSLMAHLASSPHPQPYRTRSSWGIAPRSHSVPSPSILLAPTYARPTCPRSRSLVEPGSSSCWSKVRGQGKAGMGILGGGAGGQDPREGALAGPLVSSSIPLPLFSFLLSPFPTVPPPHSLPHRHPQGHQS